MVKIYDRNYIERQSLQVFGGAPLNICMCGAKGYFFFLAVLVHCVLKQGMVVHSGLELGVFGMNVRSETGYQILIFLK